MLEDVLDEEFKKEGEQKEGVGKQFNETVASSEVRPCRLHLCPWSSPLPSTAASPSFGRWRACALPGRCIAAGVLHPGLHSVVLEHGVAAACGYGRS